MTTNVADLLNFKAGIQAGGIYLDPTKPFWVDQFLGDVLDARWSGAAGSDAQAVAPAVVAGADGGWCRLTSGDTTTVAESCVSLTHGLNYKANAGGLIFEAKVKPVTAVTTVQYFVGLTDVLATTTLEQPFTLSGTTFTAVADDAVGFVYDTDATTDVFNAIGVKATTKTAAIATVAPVAGTEIVFRIELDTDGTATFYVNGNPIGSKANAVTTTVALTPIIEVMARTTASRSIDVGHVIVGHN